MQYTGYSDGDDDDDEDDVDNDCSHWRRQEIDWDVKWRLLWTSICYMMNYEHQICGRGKEIAEVRTMKL